MNLQEFGSWGLAQGSVANPEPNNKYKGQCVSLIQQYLFKVFNKPFKAYGNAKDWATKYPKEYFNKLANNNKVQPGDVLVYGSNYGGGYGHIGLIDINGKYYDQNGIKKLAIGYRDTPFSGYVCILRPKNQNALGLNSGYNVGQTYTLITNVKVRDGAGTNARRKKKSELTTDGQKNALDQENATLKEGTKVTVQEVKNLNGDIWVRIPSGWIAVKYQGNTYLK